MKRRYLLKTLPLLPVAGSLLPTPLNLMHFNKNISKTDYFEELGVEKVINAAATMTFLSGSLMLPEVMDAINSTSNDFANMYELQDKVGVKIAEMLNCEAAMVTSGAACALVLGTAAAITGDDPEKIKSLPSFSGSRPEVIMQKKHRYVFDQAITTTGAKIIEVENVSEMEAAINENTVMALFFNAAESWFGIEDSISHQDFISVAQRYKVPSFIDAAADVPPVENLFKYQEMGFDLVTFSGGKMLRGPQSSGLLFGKKELIEAAKLNFSPHEAPIGRPMKVNKEEIFGMYAALKAYLAKDHDAEWQMWLDRTKTIGDILGELPGIKTSVNIPSGRANVFPSLDVFWPAEYSINAKDVYEELKNGKPSIICNLSKRNNRDIINIGVVLLKDKQVELVAKRLKAILIKQ
ncbi:L-seryl-tRNA(Ser) seleniumtransferase [Leeuwenhoekiella aestuarii]|uniref:L-seryl-tRNA(Ser) seleniumtransferase n=1 Tax=Leeuwenhoekiella aestuarii TaxID=2249426 RepID=A0A4V1KPZ2_9FLAO|nr:aminotransferase class V-fold PLP-dependent enzyme [Leeuwenhoekiella aestuarii]RXG18382.1 L-seryl-tRNA(Ser) seleniumtransferase [Leeuwenhoekiella aestuarii]RXG19687.1 L-seryl-tRNA(Ser) seleniumtransferase [Leeuwenhoekiella aestuarii]